MMKKLHLSPIPALSDNYIWLLHDGQQALLVDPGEEAPVRSRLLELGLTLQDILVTHHHSDHTAAVLALKHGSGATVYGPAHASIEGVDHTLADGGRFSALGLPWQALAVPGHTLSHLAFFCGAVPLSQQTAPLLFCGDTLFSGGCGRLFEGTPAQMLQSLDRLAQLPDDTLLCCGHEYTLANLRFAAAVEPDNVALKQALANAVQLRDQGQPTLPSALALERQINPFLRSRLPPVRRAVAQQIRQQPRSDAQWFAALREWKNQF